MTAAEQPFTLDGYLALVADLRRLGLTPCDFHQARPGQAPLILRHDVDYDLECADHLARAEAVAGLRSTWFLLLRTRFYNVFGHAERALCDAWRAAGHEIGLHFDAQPFGEDRAAITRAMGEDAALLAAAIGAPVRCVSFHRPARSLFAADLNCGGLVNAYGPRFVTAMGYVSDSGGAWRHGPPAAHPAAADGRGLQLLTHPVWWTGDGQAHVTERLDRLAVEAFARFRREIARHSNVYPQGNNPPPPGLVDRFYPGAGGGDGDQAVPRRR